MASKYVPAVKNSLLIGVLIAIIMAGLYLLVLGSAWGSLQSSFGHSMFHRLEQVVSGAGYAQLYSLVIVLSLLAGALATYLSGARIRTKGSAALAGVFTGLVIAAVFSLAAVVFMSLSVLSTDVGLRGDSATESLSRSLSYIVTNVPMILSVSFILPALFTVPAAAIGGLLGGRNLPGATEASNNLGLYASVLLAIAAGLVLAGIMAALISGAYGTPPALPFLFSLPFIIAQPLVAASARYPTKIFSVPLLFWILALSVLAIVLVPLASVWIACKVGIIYAPPYEWELLAP